MDTNSNLSPRLILALTLDAREIDYASAEWACIARALKPNPSLCFKISILTHLALKPSRL